MGLNEVTAGMTPQEKKSISHIWRKDTRKKLRRFRWKENGQEHTRNL